HAAATPASHRASIPHLLRERRALYGGGAALRRFVDEHYGNVMFTKPLLVQGLDMFSGLRCGLLSLSISVSAYAQENSSLTDVTVKAEKEVLVEQRDSSASPWRHVCASPCSFRPTGGEYRVIGVDVSPSKPFSI